MLSVSFRSVRDRVLSESIKSFFPSVVWKITPLFAEWIAGKGNVLFDMSDTLSTNSTVLELGCGVSGIVALATSTKVGRYIATDQEYVFKILKSNLEENASRSQRSRKPPQRQVKSKPVSYADSTRSSNIEILALDWESNSVSSLPDLLGSESPGASREIDAVVACDCIYNEALIDPFVQTCVDICRLPKAAMTENPTICIIAQQLRSHAVFETWLLAFQKMFRVWRVPDQLLTVGLLDGSGYVIHIAILRDVMG